MARRTRCSDAGYVYHVLNRAVGRATLFEKPADYAAFEKVLRQAWERTGMRLVAYVAMPNHWHLVVWPDRDGALSTWAQWLTVTHVRRWHAHHHTEGTGPIYQGRFKSFPVQEGDHYFTVCRYVERNPLRAHLVRRAEAWRWSSLWHRERATGVPWLCRAVAVACGLGGLRQRRGDGGGTGGAAAVGGAGRAVRGDGVAGADGAGVRTGVGLAATRSAEQGTPTA
jgi:REP element-mobilizing transposase RayT